MSQKNTSPNQETFVVSVVGDTTGELLTGKFTAKRRLSFNDQLRRDNHRRSMLGPAAGEPSARAASMAQIFSELLIRLIEAPSWWVDADEGRNLEDENVIVEVYEKALKIEDEALKAVKAKADPAKADLVDAIPDAKKQ